MRSVALALLLSALLVLQVALHTTGIPVLVSAPIAALLGVAAAVGVQGGFNWVAIGLGGISPVAVAWIAPWSPRLALTLLLLLWIAPRILLAKSPRQAAYLAGASLVAALVAGLMVAQFVGEDLTHHLASCVFAGAVLATTTLVVKCHSPTAHSLLAAAEVLEAPMSTTLQKAATLHSERQTWAPQRGSSAQWRALLRAADRLAVLRHAQGDSAAKLRGELEDEVESLVEAIESGKPAQQSSAAPATKPA